MNREDFTPIGRTAQTLKEENPLAAGSNAGLDGAGGSPLATREVVEWLTAHTPEQTDSEIQLRLSSRGVSSHVRMKGMYPENAPAYDIVASCEVSGDPAVIRDQIGSVERLLAPPSIRQTEAWLAELATLTASRARDGFDLELMVSAYSNRLASFPADVVKHALTAWPWKWFPTWAELEPVCKRLAARRLMLLEALRRGPTPPEQEWRTPTPEERQRMADLIAEKFPSVNPKWREAALDRVVVRDGDGETK